MSTRTLTENYRASAAVLDYVNAHKPSSPPGNLIQCDGDASSNKGLVCPPSLLPACKGLPDAPAVAQKLLEGLKPGHTVALLCRTNNQVRQWQGFLENWADPENSQKYPLRGKTRLIQDDGLKVHRLWPIWWFFHGYQHLHPVPKGNFHDWCSKLGLVDCKKKGGCACASSLQDSIAFPNIKIPPDTTDTSKIKEISHDCPKRQQINGRIADKTQLKFEVALESLKGKPCHETEWKDSILDWFQNSTCKDHLADYKAQWEQMLRNLADELQGRMVTWSQLWYWFEEYCDEIENHLPKDKIILSTIHKSKGCEFDTVFLWDWNCKVGGNWFLASDLPDGNAFTSECTGSFGRSTVGSEKKVFYVGCSRPRKNLYILPPTLEVRPATGKLVQQLATPDQVTNIFPLKEAFDYKDNKNRDYTIAFKDEKAPWMQTNWCAVRDGTHPATSSTHNEQINGSLRSDSRKHYHATCNALAVYFQGSEYEFVPLILPVIEPTLLIVTKKKSGTTTTHQAEVNQLNNSEAAEELRKVCGNGRFDLPFSKDTNQIHVKGCPILKAVNNGGGWPVIFESDRNNAVTIAWLNGNRISRGSFIKSTRGTDAVPFVDLLNKYPGCDGYVLFPSPKSKYSGRVCISWPRDHGGKNYRVGSWTKETTEIKIEFNMLECTGFKCVENTHWEDPEIPKNSEITQFGIWPIP